MISYRDALRIRSDYIAPDFFGKYGASDSVRPCRSKQLISVPKGIINIVNLEVFFEIDDELAVF